DVHPAQAPLDSWRLAAARLAHTQRRGSGWAGAEPPPPAVTLEDRRQPPAEHGGGRPAPLLPGGMDCPARLTPPLDRIGAGGGLCTMEPVDRTRGTSPPARPLVARVLRGGRARCDHQRPAGAALPRL